MGIDIAELKSCIDKNTGKSYELLVTDDGGICVSDYGGEVIKRFRSLELAMKEYIIFLSSKMMIMDIQPERSISASFQPFQVPTFILSSPFRKRGISIAASFHHPSVTQGLYMDTG